MECIINEIIQAIECYNFKDKIGCAIHLQNGGSLAKIMFMNYLKFEEFFYDI